MVHWLGERRQEYGAGAISLAEFDASVQSWITYVHHTNTWEDASMYAGHTVAQAVKIKNGARYARHLAADAACSGQTSGKAGGRPHHPQAQKAEASVGPEAVAIRRAREDLYMAPGLATHHPVGRA